MAQGTAKNICTSTDNYYKHHNVKGDETGKTHAGGK